MARNKKQQRSTSDVWTDAVEVPRSGLPDDAKRAKQFKRVRRYALLSMILVPFVAIVAILGWGVAVTNAGQEKAPVQVETAPPTRNLAMSAVQSWLDTSPSPLPGATLLSWDDWQKLPQRAKASGVEADTIKRESHRLTVRAVNGSLLTVEVLVAVDPAGTSTVLGRPSIIAQLPPNEELASADVWSGGSADSPSDAVTQAVEQWAAAYGSGDSVRLRQVVGDPDNSHVYVPLAGLTNPAAAVDKVAWKTELVDGKQERTEFLMAQATITLAWDGVEREPGTTAPTATYDLLIVGADGGAPRVVAWGGSGTAPTLKPYGNAISGIDQTVQTAVSPLKENS